MVAILELWAQYWHSLPSSFVEGVRSTRWDALYMWAMTQSEQVQQAFDFRVPHDFTASPMPAYVAWWLFAADVTTWVFYFVERRVVKRKHLKFARKLRPILALHVIGGLCETVVGLVAILDPTNLFATQTTALVALVSNKKALSPLREQCSVDALYTQAVHIPTNLLLAPHVWGLKYITVSGYVMVALLRAWEAYRVKFQPHTQHSLGFFCTGSVVRLGWPTSGCAVMQVLFRSTSVANLWILLHMATLVRMIAYLVAPWSSVDGRYGDLSTEPVVYTATIGIASLVPAPFNSSNNTFVATTEKLVHNPAFTDCHST
jgi:hypothetical protein